MSFKIRDNDIEQSFLDKMAAKGFHMVEVPIGEMHPTYRSEKIRIVEFCTKLGVGG